MRGAPISVRGLLSGLESLLQVEESVSRNGALHRIDPSIRNFSLVSITVASLFTHSILALLMMSLLLIGLVFFSRVQPRSYFVKTSVMPLFSLVIVAPILFITPGDPIWSASVGPFSLAVSQEGALRVGEFVIRVWLCVGVAALIVLISGINGLVSFLGSIRMPSLFTQILSLTYRYVFLVIGESMRMLLAREARTFKRHKRLSLEELRSLSGVITALLVRVHDRSDRVYLAMRARGFSVAPNARPGRLRPRASDISFLILVSSLLLIILNIRV